MPKLLEVGEARREIGKGVAAEVQFLQGPHLPNVDRQCHKTVAAQIQGDQL